jgi:hypothetical protein
MPTIPDSTKNSVTSRLATRARERWPQIEQVKVRFKGGYGYVDAVVDGEVWKLCRLKYAGYANSWGFAIYRASHEDYQPSWAAHRNPIRDRRRRPRHRLRPLPQRPHRLDLKPRRFNGGDH